MAVPRGLPRRETRLHALEAPQDDFYAGALSDQELPLYRRAHAARGLDGEIALLRLRLYLVLRAQAANDESGPTAQVLRIVDLLVKALRLPAASANADQAELERALAEEGARLLSEQELAE